MENLLNSALDIKMEAIGGSVIAKWLEEMILLLAAI